MKKALITSALILGSVVASQAATVITATADPTNSSDGGWGSTVAATLNDSFAYDPAAPTSSLPNLVFTAATGFHGDNAEGVDVLLSYTLGVQTTTALAPTIVVDVYGRDLAGAADRDDNFDVVLYNGDYTTEVGTVTGLGIGNDSSRHARATFNLGAGVSFDRFRIVGHDSGGGTAKNYFTLQEVRIAAVPEPSSTALLGLGGLALILRRRK